MKRSLTFYDEGIRLAGDLFLPDDAKSGEKRAGIVMCHGYASVKDMHLPHIAQSLNNSGYVVLTVDYKGWGESAGPPHRLAPYSRVADVQAAMTCLGLQDEVDEERIGLCGFSYGGSTVTWAGAVDNRAKCIVSVEGIGNGRRWMSHVRRPDEWADLLARAKTDREKRVMTGQSELAPRPDLLSLDRESVRISKEYRAKFETSTEQLPLEYVDDTIGFNPEWIVDKISPRAILFITTDDDRVVLPEESEYLYANANEPKKLVILKGYSHYGAYAGDGFPEMMKEMLDWYGQYL